jgi:non-ribosomal peptide synthetase component E (peptide arylation enzyme)
MLEGFVPWPSEYARRYREAGYWEEKTWMTMRKAQCST